MRGADRAARSLRCSCAVSSSRPSCVARDSIRSMGQVKVRPAGSKTASASPREASRSTNGPGRWPSMDRGSRRWLPSAGKPRADPDGRRSSGTPGGLNRNRRPGGAPGTAADVLPAWSAPTTSPHTVSVRQRDIVVRLSYASCARAVGDAQGRTSRCAPAPDRGAATRTGRAAAARFARWAASLLRSDHWGGGALSPLRTVGTGTAWDHSPGERHSCSKTSASIPAFRSTGPRRAISWSVWA
jgi:hypothetical protein